MRQLLMWQGLRAPLLVFLLTAPMAVLGDGRSAVAVIDARRPESLRAALDMAMTSSGGVTGGLETESSMEDARRWLGGLPMLSVSYLESDRSYGTDETEVSLRFPVKSSLQRASDATLASVDPKLDAAMRRYRVWYLSGTLRDLYARVRKAQAELPAAEMAAKLLADMESQLQGQLSAGSAERFDVIAVQQQRLNAEGRLAALNASIDEARGQFASLTAGASLPAVAGEAATLPAALIYDRHPLVELLRLNRDQQLAALRASSANATPWNLALVGRELAMPNFTEQQIGVAIDIPFSLGESASASTRSSERSLQRSFQIQRDDTLARLRADWAVLLTERERLLARQARLAQSLDQDSLGTLIRQTQRSLELPIELRLQRMLSLLQAQTEPALIAAQLDANSAALRQLAGLSL